MHAIHRDILIAKTAVIGIHDPLILATFTVAREEG